MVARESTGWLERMYEKLPPEATLLSMPDGGWDCELSTFPLPNASYTIHGILKRLDRIETKISTGAVYIHAYLRLPTSSYKRF